MDVVATIGAVAAVLAAVFGYFNGREISELRGELSGVRSVVSEHVNSAGLHRQAPASYVGETSDSA